MKTAPMEMTLHNGHSIFINPKFISSIEPVYKDMVEDWDSDLKNTVAILSMANGTTYYLAKLPINVEPVQPSKLKEATYVCGVCNADLPDSRIEPLCEKCECLCLYTRRS